MIDLDLGEELELLVQTARSFSREQLLPHLRAAESAREVAAPVRAAFAQIGLAGLELPESLGGAGLGPLARVLVNEELGAGDPGAALALDALGPALYPLLELGGEAALDRLGAPLLAEAGGRAVLVFAEDARLALEGERVSGSVPWVPAERPRLLVVLGAEEAFAVCEGIEAEPLRGAGLRAAGAAALRLSGAPLAGRWRDPAGAARARARARLHAASLLLGALRFGAEFSRDYAQQRVAFGRPIGHHQGLAFLITDMHMAVEGARLLVHEAAWRAETGSGCEAAAASAWVEVVEASRWIAPACVQILGGHGFMQDYPMEKVMREARALGLWLGGVDAAREEAGRALCAEPPPVALSPGGLL
jgi:alkylation response protein AidB-like acyl-CoA dehydrogenase